MTPNQKFTTGITLNIIGALLFIVGIGLSVTLLGACVGIPMAIAGLPLLIWGAVWIFQARNARNEQAIAAGIERGLKQSQTPVLPLDTTPVSASTALVATEGRNEPAALDAPPADATNDTP